MLGALIASGAQATVPELIPVQGVLTDGDGEFIDGATDMTFTLYDAVDATTAIWTEDQSVDVDEGFFTAYLGSVTALAPADIIAASELWLGVTVGTDEEMDRVQMAAVPFALEAQRCSQVGNLTESDINTNFLPSDYTPSWTDLTDIPAGFADNTDDGFTTEGELTALLNDNYAAISHDHDSDYLPISYVPDWSDLTGIPAGFADGIDNVGGGDSLITVTNESNTTVYFSSSSSSCATNANHSISITAPAAGTIVVHAMIWYKEYHTAGTLDQYIFALTNTAGNCSTSTSGGWDEMWVDDIPSSHASHTDSYAMANVQRTIDVSSAGTYTYYIGGYMYSGHVASTDHWWWANMTATWHP
jgi:hypothetical protein